MWSYTKIGKPWQSTKRSRSLFCTSLKILSLKILFPTFVIMAHLLWVSPQTIRCRCPLICNSVPLLGMMRQTRGVRNTLKLIYWNKLLIMFINSAKSLIILKIDLVWVLRKDSAPRVTSLITFSSSLLAFYSHQSLTIGNGKLAQEYLSLSKTTLKFMNQLSCKFLQLLIHLSFLLLVK